MNSNSHPKHLKPKRSRSRPRRSDTGHEAQLIWTCLVLAGLAIAVFYHLGNPRRMDTVADLAAGKLDRHDSPDRAAVTAKTGFTPNGLGDPFSGRVSDTLPAHAAILEAEVQVQPEAMKRSPTSEPH